MPQVNWALMVGPIAIVIRFGSSTALAASLRYRRNLDDDHRRSAEQLGLKQRDSVIAVIKSTEVMLQKN